MHVHSRLFRTVNFSYEEDIEISRIPNVQTGVATLTSGRLYYIITLVIVFIKMGQALGKII